MKLKNSKRRRKKWSVIIIISASWESIRCRYLLWTTSGRKWAHWRVCSPLERRRWCPCFSIGSRRAANLRSNSVALWRRRRPFAAQTGGCAAWTFARAASWRWSHVPRNRRPWWWPIKWTRTIEMCKSFHWWCSRLGCTERRVSVSFLRNNTKGVVRSKIYDWRWRNRCSLVIWTYQTIRICGKHIWSGGGKREPSDRRAFPDLDPRTAQLPCRNSKTRRQGTDWSGKFDLWRWSNEIENQLVIRSALLFLLFLFCFFRPDCRQSID